METQPALCKLGPKSNERLAAALDPNAGRPLVASCDTTSECITEPTELWTNKCSNVWSEIKDGNVNIIIIQGPQHDDSQKQFWFTGILWHIFSMKPTCTWSLFFCACSSLSSYKSVHTWNAKLCKLMLISSFNYNEFCCLFQAQTAQWRALRLWGSVPLI